MTNLIMPAINIFNSIYSAINVQFFSKRHINTIHAYIHINNCSLPCTTAVQEEFVGALLPIAFMDLMCTFDIMIACNQPRQLRHAVQGCVSRRHRNFIDVAMSLRRIAG